MAAFVMYDLAMFPTEFDNFFVSFWTDEVATSPFVRLWSGSGPIQELTVNDGATPGIVFVSLYTDLGTYDVTFDGSVSHVTGGINSYVISMTASGTFQCAINGMLATITSAVGSGTVFQSRSFDNGIFYGVVGHSGNRMCLSEVFIDATSTFINLGVPPNLAKFYGGLNTPVNPGADGSVPFGRRPLGYFTVRDAMALFAQTNVGYWPADQIAQGVR